MKRLITSTLMLSFVGITTFLLPDWFFAAVVTLMATVALYEFFTMIEKKHAQPFKYFGMFVGALVTLSVYFEFQLTSGWELIFIAAACLTLFALQLTRKAADQAVLSISTTIFGVLYISWFFSFLIKLKLLEGGAGLAAFLILVTKSGDIGAYLIGSAMGRHKLIKRISPRKTWEGAIGGFLCSVAAAFLVKGWAPFILPVRILMLGAALGITGQIGDLYESLIKRDCKVKDSGGILPGSGGMLDAVDNILFTAPVFYFYIKFMA